MHKLMSVVLLSFATLSSNYTYADELEDAQAWGAMLTDAIQKKVKVNLKKRQEYKEIKNFLKENECPGIKYEGYLIGEERQYFYLIGSKGKEVIIGRHFKAPVVDGVIALDSAQSSTKGCLSLGPKKPDVSAMFATHLQPFPNEFHLLQSNIHAVTLYIGTKSGMYVVKEGKMYLSESK